MNSSPFILKGSARFGGQVRPSKRRRTRGGGSFEKAVAPRADTARPRRCDVPPATRALYGDPAGKYWHFLGCLDETQFRFPTGPATDAQRKRLDDLITRYIRVCVIRNYDDLRPATLARVFGISDRHTRDLFETAESVEYSPIVDATLELLTGMARKTHPNLDALPSCTETRWFLREVRDRGLPECEEVVTEDVEWLRSVMDRFRVDLHNWLVRFYRRKAK